MKQRNKGVMPSHTKELRTVLRVEGNAWTMLASKQGFLSKHDSRRVVELHELPFGRESASNASPGRWQRWQDGSGTSGGGVKLAGRGVSRGKKLAAKRAASEKNAFFPLFALEPH